MPLCPICDAKLKQDFGMVTCHKCQAVLMIDFSGQIQVGVETLSETDEEIQSSVTENVEEIKEEEFDYQENQLSGNSENSQTQDFDPFQEENKGEDARFFDHSSTVDPSNNDGFFPAGEESQYSNEDEIIESESGVFEESKVNINIPNFDDLESRESLKADTDIAEDIGESYEVRTDQDFSDDDSKAIDSGLGISEEPDQEPIDITSFANSQESNLADGEYLYDLVVSRIDSKELRDELKAVLQDEKLKLNFHEYIRKIKAGSVTIANLNPIKTKRIVEQLQYLDLQIHWTQKRVVMQKDQSTEEGENDEEESAEDIGL